MAIKTEVRAGELLRDTVTRAYGLAKKEKDAVEFDFNDWEIKVLPTRTLEETIQQVEEHTGIELLTREQVAERAREDLERSQREADEAMAEADVPDEEALREAEVPTPENLEALIRYIASMVERPHDYGTCVYAMSMSALAAYKYAARQLGVTGFQASMADMDFLKRSRNMEMGFRLVNYADLMYPQYWEKGVNEVYFTHLLAESSDLRRALAEKAREELETQDEVTVHPNVWDHWQRLASMRVDEGSPEGE